MRVTTAFNKMLAVPGASVALVVFAPEGVIVGLRRRRRRPMCPCGWKGRAVYDRSTRRWRHLDLGAVKLFLEAEIRRIHCQRCDRVRTEAVDWARPRARHTRDFEDVVAWLCQHTDKTTVTKLLGTSWETVAGVVGRVVAEHIDTRRSAAHGKVRRTTSLSGNSSTTRDRSTETWSRTAGNVASGLQPVSLSAGCSRGLPAVDVLADTACPQRERNRRAGLATSATREGPRKQ